VVLIGAYVAVMVAAAFLLPPSWDWSVWDWMSAQHAPVFDIDEIAIVDVPWSADLAVDRRRIATFLDEVARKQKPTAVILDVEFGPCQTQPCGEPMESARRRLIASIRAATPSFAVYALEQPTLTGEDTATGIHPHDSDIYAVLTGAAHTRFTASPSALFYRACYPVSIVEKDGSLETVALWDMVPRLMMHPGKVAQTACDTSDFPVRLAAEPNAPARAARTTLLSQGAYPAGAHFDGKYVIVGTVSESDPGYGTLRGPEILAWAISNALDLATADNAHLKYDTEPQGGMLLVLVPGFSALTLSAFIAIFFLLKRTRLQSLRRALPWLSAVAAVCAGLAVFAAFEAWLLATGHIQPQVTLIALGVVLTAVLASLRAFQVLFAEQWSIDRPRQESYDYDVFLSYAHDEGAWVFEHVVVPLRAARLPGDRQLKIFFDTSSIRYGAAWQDDISLAIDGSRFVVPVYSETYFKSNYCTFEIRRAHLKWIAAGSMSRVVLPVMRGKPTILPTVRDIQAVSVDDDPNLVEKIVSEIVERLAKLGVPETKA
jgi:hypothetical protein